MKTTEDKHIPDVAVETEGLARSLAAFAALPLSAERETAAAMILAAWLPLANELSRKMSAPGYRSLVPATVFTHPTCFDDEAIS